ncbi:MAG TPA: MerR family transcriptional regulator [Xanthobacteraceae bacterium]|nr:MerR family transcriptional regulator [Xanthobacteraceae bacterium]
MEKGPDAFRTISEVAEDLDLPQHVLRFWETRFAQIKPLKRGGGRRYYRPDDIDLLRGIRHLLYGDGYTIRGVQQILREQGVRHVQSIGRSAEVDAPKPAPGFNSGFRAGGTVDDRPSAPRDGGMALIDLLPSLRSSRPTPDLPRVVEVPIPQQRSAVDTDSDEEMPPFPFRRAPAQLSPAEMATRLAPRPQGEPEAAGAIRPQSFIRPVESRVVGGDTSRLSAEAVRLLKATLFELGECKRLLDAGREEPA